jgi:hypothetical protein
MALQLEPEIWAHIFGYLLRPLPELDTPDGTLAWADLHQRDLAVVLRVHSVSRSGRRWCGVLMGVRTFTRWLYRCCIGR